VLTIPPLRERGDDVLRLAAHFLDRARARITACPSRSFTPDARAALLAYPWPGNVRELANVMERVVPDHRVPVVTAEHLGLSTAPAEVADDIGPEPETEGEPTLAKSLDAVERAHLVEALRLTGGNVTRAAARLHISRDTLRYRMAKHGLTRERPERPPRPRTSRGRSLPSPARSPHPRRSPPREPAARSPAAAEPGASLAVRWEGRRLAFLRSALILPPEADPAFSPSRGLETLMEKIRTFGGRIEDSSPTGHHRGVRAGAGRGRRHSGRRWPATAVHKAAERASVEGVGIGVRSGDRRAVTCAIGTSRAGIHIDLDGKRETWATLDQPPHARRAGRDPGGGSRGQLPRPGISTSRPKGWRGRPDPCTACSRPRAEARGPAPRVAARSWDAPGSSVFLWSRLEDALRGHGQVVGLLGEAGIGKSRLAPGIPRAAARRARAAR
jgi:hypothetical protein